MRERLKTGKMRMVMYGVESVLSILGIVFLILNIVGDQNPSIYGAACSAIAAGVALMIIEKLFNFQLPLNLHVILFIYIFMSNIIGSNLKVFLITAWYDKVMHALLGYVLCIVAVWLMKVFKVKSKTVAGDIFVIFCISMMYAAVWEFIEFFSDCFLGQNMQHGNIDTMLDITAHLVLTIFFCLQYGVYKCTKYSLGMRFILKGLEYEPNSEVSKSGDETAVSDEDSED